MEPFSLDLRIPPNMNGRRLDAALAELLPDMGVRTARRILETHAALLNGKPASKGQILHENDHLNVFPLHDILFPENMPKPVLLACHGDFLTFLKPANIHCAHIKGTSGPSLEAALAAHAPFFLNSCVISNPTQKKGALKLLTRLDYETSGIVLAAATQKAETLFREQERAGHVGKCYLAVVQGALSRTLRIANRLDMSKRTKTRILDEPDPDPTRHTAVFPIAILKGTNATLVQAHIKRGARHQIRAHLAHAGFPLVNDAVYGGKETTPGQHFLLHHFQLNMPAFTVTNFPNWNPTIQAYLDHARNALQQPRSSLFSFGG